MKSKHQHRVEEFMLRAGQEVPVEISVPSEEVRLLRAALIMEEALETIQDGLGISCYCHGNYVDRRGISYQILKDFNLEETVDGCCDIKVVTTGTLSACGVEDEDIQEEVDKNNLKKFGLGHTIREDGKLIKPPDHKPPNIGAVLRKQAQEWH